MLRHIPMGKMLNLRDLGGYPTADGRETKWEHFLRGDVPDGLTENEIRWLLDRGITTIIDLRSGFEVGNRPDQLASTSGFTYFHHPLSDDNFMPNLEEDIGRGYFMMLDGRKRMYEVMHCIAQAPGGVLFHCTAGKDRTGCTAALLLLLARVGRTDVLADYQVSETYIMEIIRKIKAQVPDIAAFLGRSRAEYMDECLELLFEKYGDAAGYLRAIGLTEAELGILSKKLLD